MHMMNNNEYENRLYGSTIWLIYNCIENRAHFQKSKLLLMSVHAKRKTETSTKEDELKTDKCVTEEARKISLT